MREQFQEDRACQVILRPLQSRAESRRRTGGTGAQRAALERKWAVRKVRRLYVPS
jgi:hypothetical protein